MLDSKPYCVHINGYKVTKRVNVSFSIPLRPSITRNFISKRYFSGRFVVVYINELLHFRRSHKCYVLNISSGRDY